MSPGIQSDTVPVTPDSSVKNLRITKSCRLIPAFLPVLGSAVGAVCDCAHESRASILRFAWFLWIWYSFLRKSHDMSSNHAWKFFRAGGFDQVRLSTGADLMALDQLDQKLWVALACPTTGLEFDVKTAALIDVDKDGRIRVPELIAAVKWAGSMLKNPDDLITGGDSVAV